GLAGPGYDANATRTTKNAPRRAHGVSAPIACVSIDPSPGEHATGDHHAGAKSVRVGCAEGLRWSSGRDRTAKAPRPPAPGPAAAATVLAILRPAPGARRLAVGALSAGCRPGAGAGLRRSGHLGSLDGEHHQVLRSQRALGPGRRARDPRHRVVPVANLDCDRWPRGNGDEPVRRHLEGD